MSRGVFPRRMATTAPWGIMPWCDSQEAISSRETCALLWARALGSAFESFVFKSSVFKSMTTSGAMRRSGGIWPADQVPGIRAPGAMIRVVDTAAADSVEVVAGETGDEFALWALVRLTWVRSTTVRSTTCE